MMFPGSGFVGIALLFGALCVLVYGFWPVLRCAVAGKASAEQKDFDLMKEQFEIKDKIRALDLINPPLPTEIESQERQLQVLKKRLAKVNKKLGELDSLDGG